VLALKTSLKQVILIWNTMKPLSGQTKYTSGKYVETYARSVNKITMAFIRHTLLLFCGMYY